MSVRACLCVRARVCVCLSVCCVRLIRPREKSQRADIFLPPRLSPVAAVPELCDICSLTGSLCCSSQHLARTRAHARARTHTLLLHKVWTYCWTIQTHTHIQLHQVNYLRQRAVFTVHTDTFWFPHGLCACVCMCVTNRLEHRHQSSTGFLSQNYRGMLMTKPNYRGLIAATFTKLITAKRRQALQVIHSVGY